jgi:hypothetical protein
MPHQNGAGPDHRGDGGEAQSSVLGWLATATDSRPHANLQLVRADLIGVDTCTAASITAHGRACVWPACATVASFAAPCSASKDRPANQHDLCRNGRRDISSLRAAWFASCLAGLRAKLTIGLRHRFAVKTWFDYHKVPTLFLVVDEDDCEIARFPSEGEATPRQRKRLLAEAQDILADRELSDMRLTHVCPDCGGHADIIGGHNSIDYVRCGACGYYGDHFEEEGVVCAIRVATEGGLRRMDEAAYEKCIAEIKARQPLASK